MSIDIEALSGVYEVMMEYVPLKDKQVAVDHVFSMLSESSLSDKELKELCSSDSYLITAYNENQDEEELE